MKIDDVSVSLLRYRLAKPVGGSGVAAVDVVVARVKAERAEGLGFSYVLGGSGAVAAAAAKELAEAHVKGQPLHHPEAAWRRMTASLNRTGRGPSYIGLAALDVALWDAHARALGVPLGIAMGGAPRAVPVYGSGGFNATQSPEQAAQVAKAHAGKGFRAVKPRVAGKASDEKLIAAVREAVPAVAVMVDANEKCSATQAARLLSVAREQRVLFVEEPLPASDLAGYRALARSFQNVATGEHLQGAVEAQPFLAERLCSLMQPDLAMMGGLTECLRTARLAEAFGTEVSPHFLPGLFIHLAAACPNLTWLEDFPLLEPLFEGGPAMAADGTLALPLGAGHGLRLAEGAEREFEVDA